MLVIVYTVKQQAKVYAQTANRKEEKECINKKKLYTRKELPREKKERRRNECIQTTNEASPRKSLFSKIHHSPLPNPLPSRRPHLISKSPRPTNTNERRTRPTGQNLIKNNIRPAATRMHKHRRGRTDDIRRATRLRDEKLHDENIPSIRQAQDLVHEAAYPGEVVC